MRDKTFDSIIVGEAVLRLHDYMQSTVPSGTSVGFVLNQAQRVQTAIQILDGTLEVVESRVMLEYVDVQTKGEK